MTATHPADGTGRPAQGGLWCCALELSGTAGVTAVDPRSADQRRVRVLVRLHDEPLGYLASELPRDGPDDAALRASAARSWHERIRGHLAAEGVPHPSPDHDIPVAGAGCPAQVESREPVSVVVCTRNRSEQLAGCLAGLRELTYPHTEIIVVDNAPCDESTRLAVGRAAALDPRVRYVREPRPGLSCARNAGLAAATGAIVAYTDDDVVVDPRWLDGVVRGFQRRPDVGCVTGLVCAASVGTGAEAYFDARAASWSTRFEPELFDLADRAGRNALYPYSPGIFGTGASFAFDRLLVVGLGGFDEALGAGTRTRGGEDLDIFVRVLRAGRAIAYEPAALVWHHHRAGERELLTQMFGYGTGLTAFVAKCLRQRETRVDVLRRIPGGLARVAAIRSSTAGRLGDDARAPRGALLREFAGFAAGPFLYAQAERSVRRAARG